jgi:hypothetical protein
MPAQASLDDVAVFSFKGGQAGVEHFPLRHDHDVEAARDLVTTKNLSNQSFSSVSLDGAAELLCRRNAQPARRRLTRKKEDGEEPPVHPRASLVDLLELGAATKAFTPRETTRQHFHGHGGGLRSLYSLLTDRRLRPLARLRARTIRPFLVLMRTRNPCVRFRWPRFG